MPAEPSTQSVSEDHQKAVDAPSTWLTIIPRVIREPFSGAWQRNKELTTDEGLTYPIVFACVSRISDDISKISLSHQKRDQYRLYQRVRGSKVDRLLKNPNSYQTGQQFIAEWEASVQSRGNAYVFKKRSRGGAVESLHVLNPSLVTPLVTPSGAVYYRIQSSDLYNGLARIDAGDTEIIIPASEIIHDRINCFFHPLIGLSPLYAAALNVWLGKRSLHQQTEFFENGATPGGILIFPGNLGEEKAKEIGRTWNAQYSGDGRYKTAVLGDGVKYQQLGIPAADSQLIEQLRYGAEMICGVFHVPPYKVGVGQTPAYSNIEAVNQMYFSDCLQSRIVSIQNVLREGLELAENEAVRFDLDALLLMDSKTRMEVAVGLRRGGIEKIDESRARFNHPPVNGGNAIYLQQQDHSLDALARRDENAFMPSTEPPIEPLEPQKDYTGLLGLISLVKEGKTAPDVAKAFALVQYPELTNDVLTSLFPQPKKLSIDTAMVIESFEKGLSGAK